ncbi:hypothetical protein BASA81_008133 [Batrachochytrium salamandrivorans]|nr:hypothetical protein BASA81_008133 [Batrachochytrium salamandrivorans]
MKVKALVVAAMVITSVNAGLHRKGEDALQTEICELNRKAHIYQAAISELENRAPWVSPKQVQTHYASYSEARAKMEASKEQSTNLRREYRGIFRTRKTMDCDETVFRDIFQKGRTMFSFI